MGDDDDARGRHGARTPETPADVSRKQSRKLVSPPFLSVFVAPVWTAF